MKMGRKVSEVRLNSEVKCKVCKVVLKNYIALTKHLKYQHSLSSEAYYLNIGLSMLLLCCLTYQITCYMRYYVK